MPTELGWSVFWAGRSSDETKCRAASSGRDALMVMVTCVVVKDKEAGATVLGELKSGPPFLFLDMDMTTVRREICAPINTMPVPQRGIDPVCSDARPRRRWKHFWGQTVFIHAISNHGQQTGHVAMPCPDETSDVREGCRVGENEMLGKKPVMAAKTDICQSTGGVFSG